MKQISYEPAITVSVLPTPTMPLLGVIVNYSGRPYWCSGTAWIPLTASPAAGSYSTIIGAWSLVSGNMYQATVTHNLGTRAIGVTLWDTVTNTLVEADSITADTLNSVVVGVAGNTANLLCVVIANGSSVVVGSSGIPLKSFTYYAESLGSPNNADWAVNALAPLFADPVYPALNTRQFSNTVEQGVGFNLSIPEGATLATLRFRGRAQVAQATAQIIQLNLRTRQIPNNAPVAAWGSYNLGNFAVPANAYFQSFTVQLPIAALSLVEYSLFQCELTRAASVTGGTQLATNWLMAEMTVEFM